MDCELVSINFNKLLKFHTELDRENKRKVAYTVLKTVGKAGKRAEGRRKKSWRHNFWDLISIRSNAEFLRLAKDNKILDKHLKR